MTDAPHSLAKLNRQKFLDWLEGSGASLQETTNPYEVIRYKMWMPSDTKRPSTHIIYKRSNGTLTYHGGSRQHYETFQKYGPKVTQ